ncbi:MAG: LamG domain-containing protein, partial [Ferruginibacter sp.]
MKYVISIATALFIFTAVASAQYNTGYNNSSFAATQNGLLNGASTFTVEFWVKTTENRSNDLYWQRPYFFGNATNGDNSGDFGITSNNGYVGMWEGFSNLNTDQQFLSTSVRINDNFWHHIAAVNNGQVLNLYVDGNIIGSLVSGRQLITTMAPLTFGAASLDFNSNNSAHGNVDFMSQSSFGEARISSTARYNSNFMPSQNFSSDAFTVSLFHFGNQNYNQNNNNNNNNNNTNYNQNNNLNYNQNYNQPLNPNEPVTFEPNQPINENAAQAATLYLKDSSVLTGKLLLGKKDWSLSNEIYIRFFEGNSHKVKYYKADDILGFQMG